MSPARVTIAFDVPDDLDPKLAARRIGALARTSGLAEATRTRRRGSNGSIAKEEAPDHVRRVSAMLAGMRRRAASGDLDQITALHGLLRVVEDELGQAVAAAVTGPGYTWAQIGEATGMARQSAYERWAKRITRPAGG